MTDDDIKRAKAISDACRSPGKFIPLQGGTAFSEAIADIIDALLAERERLVKENAAPTAPAQSHIPTWQERCETHPDHQGGMVSNRMIQARMQEEIDALRDERDELLDKALRYDLDQIGIDSRAQEEIELVELRAERERLKDRADHYIDEWSDVCNENQQLINERDALRADAERYRWLRNWMIKQGLLRHQECQPEAGMRVGWWYVFRKPYAIGNFISYGSTPDAAIDEARKEQS